MLLYKGSSLPEFGNRRIAKGMEKIVGPEFNCTPD